MQNIHIQNYKSPVGEMILGSYGDKLCLADWVYRKKRNGIDRRLQKALGAEYVEERSAVIEEAIHQLDEYFAHTRKQF